VSGAKNAEFVPVLVANLRPQKQVAGQMHRYAAPELREQNRIVIVARTWDVIAVAVLHGGVNPK
jgi:hypothetical protein